MPATYEPIATTTLGSAANSITFSTISGSYTDIRLVLVCQNTVNNYSVLIRFNSDTGSNYSYTNLYGNGSSATSGRATSATSLDPSGFGQLLSPNWTLYTIDLFSYSGATNKTVLMSAAEDNNGSGGVRAAVGLWRNTAAITTIGLSTSGNFATGTTATLYGILKA